MICSQCGGQVIWMGPLGALTHTECQNCGAVNRQKPESCDQDENTFPASSDAYETPPVVKSPAEPLIHGSGSGEAAGVDLWNQPLGSFKRKGKRDESARGYASRPGSGPAGESCKTCKHLCRVQHAKTYLKCGRVKHAWTGGPKTDVRAKSPACQLWERGEG